MSRNGGSGPKDTGRDANGSATASGKPNINPCGACPVRGLAVCGALAPDELYALAEIVHQVSYGPRQTVFLQGDKAKHYSVMTSGVASLSKLLPDGRRQITGFLYPADFYGIAVDGGYANSLTAVTHLRLCCFLRGKYEELLEKFPNLESRLLLHASNELAIAQEQMLLLGRKVAVEKLASFLLMVSDRVGRSGQADNRLWLPMTREDIGDYIGLTMETTSRMFSELQKLGAISRRPDGKIDVLDKQLLRGISKGE